MDSHRTVDSIEKEIELSTTYSPITINELPSEMQESSWEYILSLNLFGSKEDFMLGFLFANAIAFHHTFKAIEHFRHSRFSHERLGASEFFETAERKCPEWKRTNEFALQFLKQLGWEPDQHKDGLLDFKAVDAPNRPLTLFRHIVGGLYLRLHASREELARRIGQAVGPVELSEITSKILTTILGLPEQYSAREKGSLLTRTIETIRREHELTSRRRR